MIKNRRGVTYKLFLASGTLRVNDILSLNNLLNASFFIILSILFLSMNGTSVTGSPSSPNPGIILSSSALMMASKE